MCGLFINVRFSPSLSEHVVAMEVGPVLARFHSVLYRSVMIPLTFALSPELTNPQPGLPNNFSFLLFHFLFYFCFISFSNHSFSTLFFPFLFKQYHRSKIVNVLLLCGCSLIKAVVMFSSHNSKIETVILRSFKLFKF